MTLSLNLSSVIIYIYTDAVWRMLLYAYFILNYGLHNFNLYIDALWFNPLGSGYVIRASRSKWYCSFVLFYPLTTGSDICKYNLLFSPTRLWCIHIEEKGTAFENWGLKAWYIRFLRRIYEEYVERTEGVLEKQDIILHWILSIDSVWLFLRFKLCGEYHSIVQSNLNILFLLFL
jgi:hypothetical protein